MLPAQPSAVRCKPAPSTGPSHPRPSWRQTLDEIGWFFLIINLAWVIALVLFVLIR